MRWTLFAIAIVASVLFLSAASAKTVLNDEPLDDCRLFFHSDGGDAVGQYNMTTRGPGSGDGTQIGVGSGENATRDYILNKTLQYDLEAVGKDLGGPKGMRANIQLSCSGIGGTTEAKVGVIELRGTNETLVAESEWRTAQTTWDIPFVDAQWNSYTFRAGSSIVFRITVTTDAILGGSCSVNTDGPDYFLNLTCSPVEARFTINVWDYTETDDETQEFYPNLPAEIAFMNLTGDFRNAFGSYDVKEVTIDIDRIGSETGSYLDDQVAGHQNNYKDDDVYRYHHQWRWNPKNVTASDTKSGSDGYNIVISYENDFGHKFRMTNMTFHFDMLQYGVLVQFWDDIEHEWTKDIERNGEANSTIELALSVFNIGLEEETVTLETLNPKAYEGWTIDLDDDNFILDGGGNATITATVGIPDIEPGKRAGFDIEASISEDADAFDSVELTAVALGVIDFDFYLTDGNYSKRVGRSETATFPFTLKNTGNDEIDFDFTSDPETAPTGWTIEFDPQPPFESVEPDAERTLLFHVTSPSDEVGVETNPQFEISAWPVGHNDLEQKHDIDVTLDTYALIEAISSQEEVCLLVDYSPHFVYGAAEFGLTLYNGEAEEREITVSVDFEQSDIEASDWDIEFEPIGGVVTVDSGDTAIVDVMLTPEEDFTPGEYDIVIEAAITGVKTEIKAVSVVVEEYVQATFELTTPTSYKDVEEGDSVRISFDIVNTGNLDDGFLVLVSGIDSKWNVRIDGDTGTQRTITVPSLGSKTVEIVLVPPEEAQGDDFTVTVHVESNSDAGVSEDFSVKISVEEEPTDPTSVLYDLVPLFLIIVILAVVFLFYRRKTSKKTE